MITATTLPRYNLGGFGISSGITSSTKTGVLMESGPPTQSPQLVASVLGPISKAASASKSIQASTVLRNLVNKPSQKASKRSLIGQKFTSVTTVKTSNGQVIPQQTEEVHTQSASDQEASGETFSQPSTEGEPPSDLVTSSGNGASTLASEDLADVADAAIIQAQTAAQNTSDMIASKIPEAMQPVWKDYGKWIVIGGIALGGFFLLRSLNR